MTVLGTDENGKNVEISVYDRLTSVYCLGATGSGKTTLLQNIILQDIEAGIGVCLLDPHGDLIDKIINKIPWNRINDVILLDPIELAKQEYYFGLNLFECIDTNNVEFYQHTVEQVMETFKKLWGPGSENPSWGPQLEDLLLNITITLIENQGYTFAEVPMLLRNDAFRKRLVDTLTNSQVKSFWEWEYNPLSPKDQREMSFSTLNKVRIFTTNPIIYYTTAQSHTTINFRTIMDVPPPEPGKILLIRLDRSLAVMTSFLGSILINQLLLAALSRRDIPEKERRIFCLFCDEFQNFATPSMNTLLVEARKYRVASHLFHQTRQQEGITDSIRSTTMGAGSLVVFRVNSDDAKELAGSFNLSPPTETIERPVRAPAQNVLETLLNRGSHEDPKVNEFVQKYLRPLTQATGDRIEKNSADYEDTYEVLPRVVYPEGSYGYDPRLIRQELNTLNIMLFDSMTGKKYKNNEGPDIIRMNAAFGMYLGFSHYFTHKDIPNLRIWDSKRQLYLIEYYLDSDVKSPPEHYLDLMAQLSSQQFHVVKDNMPLNLTYFYTTLPVTTDIHNMRMVARDIMQAEKKRAEDFLEAFFGILDGVAKSPVMIDSGKIELIEQAATTFADRANAVANELTQLPRFHAKVKIPSGEYVIYNSAPQGDFKSLAAKKQQIIGNTKRLYCKSRAEIEEEIRRRQEPLEPPTTRKYTL